MWPILEKTVKTTQTEKSKRKAVQRALVHRSIPVRSIESVIAGWILVWMGAQAPLCGQTNLVLSQTGKTNQFVEISDSPQFAFTTNITAEAWLLVPGNFGTNASLPFTALGKRAPDGGTGLRLGLGSPTYAFEVFGPDGAHSRAGSVSDMAFWVWAHVTATSDGTYTRIYVDGAERGFTRTAPFSFQKSSFPLLIGKEGLSGNEKPWVGQIDEVRLWNRVLTADEIRSGMRTKLAGNEPGLVGYWNFDQKDARDLSVYGNHGIIRGTAPLVESTLFLASRPELQTPRLLPGQGVEFFLKAEAGVSYTIQRSADLKVWEDMGRISGQNGSVRFLDSANHGQREMFYRAAVNYAGPL